jgi:hypothetical protein
MLHRQGELMAGHHEDASFAVPDSTARLTEAWLLGTLDRALKSIAATLLLLLGGGTTGLNLLQVDWKAALLTAASAGVVSILTSLASGYVGDPGTTSALPGGR